MALLAMMNNQGYMQDVRDQIMANDVSSGGAVDRNFEVISETAGYKISRASEAKDIAEKERLDGLTSKIGDVAEAFNRLAGGHSGLIGATTLATSALTAFAGVAGVATIAMGGKGILGRAGGGIARKVGGAAGGIFRTIGSAATAGISSKLGKSALRLAKGGGVAAVGSMAGGYLLEKGFGEDSAVTRYGGRALDFAGVGATVGSLIAPGIGTAIGGALGGVGGVIYQGISDWLKSDVKEVASQQQEQPQQVEIDASLKIGLAPGLVLQGQSMSSSGGTLKMSTGNIYAGAPS